jgi:hypothetical protein
MFLRNDGRPYLPTSPYSIEPIFLHDPVAEWATCHTVVCVSLYTCPQKSLLFSFEHRFTAIYKLSSVTNIWPPKRCFNSVNRWSDICEATVFSDNNMGGSRLETQSEAHCLDWGLSSVCAVKFRDRTLQQKTTVSLHILSNPYFHLKPYTLCSLDTFLLDHRHHHHHHQWRYSPESGLGLPFGFRDS